VIQAAKRVEPAHVVQINQIVEGWRNENGDTLNYKEQQNREGNGDLYVNENMQENILRVISNIFHLLSIDEH